MPATLLMLAVVAATSHGAPLQVRFTGDIQPASALAMETHDLGGNVVAHVVTYREAHMPWENRNETREVLAYADDGISIETSGHLAVRRWRRDGWPEEVIARAAP